MLQHTWSKFTTPLFHLYAKHFSHAKGHCKYVVSINDYYNENK